MNTGGPIGLIVLNMGLEIVIYTVTLLSYGIRDSLPHYRIQDFDYFVDPHATDGSYPR